MSDTPVSSCVEVFNRKFANAIEFLEPVIRERMRKMRSLFRDLIPRGQFTLGEGLTRKSFIFHPGLGDQGGLTTWSTIQTGRAPGTNGPNDPGYDACKYNAYMLSYGFEAKDYTGFHTERRTPDICLKDIIYNWQFKQQLKLIFSYLADVTLSIWDNFGREYYVSLCNKVILTSDPQTQVFTYDPFTDTSITIPRNIDISVLTEKHLSYWYQFLSLQVPQGAVAFDAGAPVFGMVIHPVDFDDLLHRDANLREDFHYANPDVLIENYGKVKNFKGWSFFHDIEAIRFKVGSIAATTITLNRVLPYKGTVTTIGQKMDVDPNYITAEYAIAIIFIKNVYEILIPPTIAAPGGGTEFGATPNNTGDFKWLNIQDRCDNLLMEKGFYFGRYNAFPRPLDYVDDAVCFLYKRCVGTPVATCLTLGTSGAKTIVGGAVAIDPAGTGSYNQVQLTLATALPCAAPAEVTVTFANASTATAVLSDDSSAPTYTLTFATSADWVAYGAGIASVTCV